MFMQPQVYQDHYFVVETRDGDFVVPSDVIGRTCDTVAEAFADYVDGRIDDGDASVECRHGWLARMAAPGYMDCTDWTAHATEQEAHDYLHEQGARFPHDPEVRAARAEAARETVALENVCAFGSWETDPETDEMKCAVYVERPGQDSERFTFVVAFVGDDVSEAYAIDARGRVYE